MIFMKGKEEKRRGKMGNLEKERTILPQMKRASLQLSICLLSVCSCSTGTCIRGIVERQKYPLKAIF